MTPKNENRDEIARARVRTVHKMLLELERDLTRKLQLLERVVTRRAGFVARCALCGDPCKPNQRYCRAHKWAEG